MKMKKTILVTVSMACGAVWADGLDLNGSWEFRFEEGKSIAQVSTERFEATDSVVVPGCYDMLPKFYLKRGTGLYRKTFTLAQPVEDASLVVDGMGLTGAFWVDGKSLGIHPYPYAKLALKVGSLDAGTHTVVAALDNRFDWETQKLARPYYDFYCHGGFYHGVRLDFDSRRLLVRTRDHATGLVEIEAEGFAVSDFDAELCFDGKNRVNVAFKGGRAKVNVPDFRLWSPDSPNLHIVTLGMSGKPAVSARFGIRTVEVRDRKICLNGKPIYLKGANRHESHPTFGAATPEHIMLTDIQNLKAMGGNFIRGAHYQQAQRFLDLCDENGVLVWEESLGWGNGSHHEMAKCELTNETFRAQQLLTTREMVRHSFNHPSIIIFAFMNEFLSSSKDGKSLADELIKAIKAEDSGRLVTFAVCHKKTDISNENTDIVAFNTYPGWFDSIGVGDDANLRRIIAKDLESNVSRFRKLYPDKPIMVAEMGACGIYGFHDRGAAQWTEEFQAQFLSAIIDNVFAENDICGFTVWHFADARSYHRSGGALRGKPLAENLGGIFDGYRRPKMAVDVVTQKFWAKDRAR